MVNRFKSICSNKILLDRDFNKLKESILWSFYPNFIIENFFKNAIKQKLKQFQYSGLDVPKNQQIFFGFQYINESSIKICPNRFKLNFKTFQFY